MRCPIRRLRQKIPEPIHVLTLLTPEIVNWSKRSVLCWLATVDEKGQPSVSPKEIYAIFDASHIVIANIASPTSARDLALSPRVCVSFLDVFAQKGYKVLGAAINVSRTDALFGHWAPPLIDMAGPRFPIHSVFVVEAQAVEPILAPSYCLYPDEVTEQTQVEAAYRTYGVRPR